MTADPEKERFLKEFGHDYGYPNAPKNVDQIRATEFKLLNDTVYLDHGGATLYSESQMEDVFKDFKMEVKNYVSALIYYTYLHDTYNLVAFLSK